MSGLSRVEPRSIRRELADRCLSGTWPWVRDAVEFGYVDWTLAKLVSGEKMACVTPRSFSLQNSRNGGRFFTSTSPSCRIDAMVIEFLQSADVSVHATPQDTDNTNAVTMTTGSRLAGGKIQNTYAIVLNPYSFDNCLALTKCVGLNSPDARSRDLENVANHALFRPQLRLPKSESPCQRGTIPHRGSYCMAKLGSLKSPHSGHTWTWTEPQGVSSELLPFKSWYYISYGIPIGQFIELLVPDLRQGR